MLVLGVGDKLRGSCSSAAAIDYSFHGLIDGVLAPLAQGQLPAVEDDLFTATVVTVVKTCVFTANGTDETFSFLLEPAVGTKVALIARDILLSSGHSLHTDFEKVTVLSDEGSIVFGYIHHTHLAADITDVVVVGTTGSTLVQYNEAISSEELPGSTETIDLANGPLQRFKLDVSCVFTMPTIPVVDGETASFVLILEPNTFTPTFNAAPTIKWMTTDGLIPTFNLDADLVNVVTFIADTKETTPRWLGFFGGAEAA